MNNPVGDSEMEEPIANGDKSEIRDETGRFVPGNPGGPGRPKGSRNRLAESFFKALADDFEQHGIEAIRAARANNPGEYARIVAGLQKQLAEVEAEVQVSSFKWEK
jgi:hypothetical protein